MSFDEASRWCLEHDARLSTDRGPDGARLTLSAYGLSMSEALQDESWRTWHETLVRLVALLQRRMPRA